MEQSITNSRRIEGPDWDRLGREITSAKWLVWQVCSYIRSRTRFLVNYDARHRKRLSISSSVAESAVNQVVSVRMAKQQQVR